MDTRTKSLLTNVAAGFFAVVAIVQAFFAGLISVTTMRVLIFGGVAAFVVVHSLWRRP